MDYDMDEKYPAAFLRDLSNGELQSLTAQARRTLLELAEIKAQALGYVERPHLFKKIRRDIARFKTLIGSF